MQSHRHAIRAILTLTFVWATLIFAAETPTASIRSQLIGTWQCIPDRDEPNTFLKLTLAADESWAWSVVSTKPNVDPNKYAGAWFVHDRAVVLRLDDNAPKMWKKMAYVFDLKSITAQSWTSTNSPLGDVTWTRAEP